MCDLIDDPGGGVAGFSDHGMYDIRTLNVTRGHVQNVCNTRAYDSIATVGESRVWWRADFQSGSRVLKKVF